MIWTLLIVTLCALPNLNVRLEAGIGGLCRRNDWVEVRVEVETGKEWLIGKIKARVEGEDVIASTDVQIPPYARRAILMNLPAPDFPSELQVTVENENGEVFLNRKTRIFPIREQDLIVAIVSDIRSDVNFLDGNVFSIDRSPLAKEQIVRTITVPVRRVSRAIELIPLDLILLHSRPSPEKVKELRRWVALGGVLVICKGFETEGLNPARVQDSLILKSINTPIFSISDQRVEVAYIEPKGKVLLETTDGLPIVVSKRLGDGELVYVAFDPLLPPFTLPRIGGRLWKWLLEISRPSIKRYRVYDPQNRFQRKVISLLKAEKGRRLAVTVLSYLGAYTAILSVLVILSGKLKTRTLILAPLACSFFISVVAMVQIIFGNQAEIRRLALLRAYAGEEIALKSEWIYISSRFKSRARLDLEGRRVIPLTPSQTPILLHPDKGEAVIEINPFMDVVLYSRSIEEFGGVSMRLEDKEAELINDSPYDISDLIVCGGGGIGFLNYLASGVRARVELSKGRSFRNILNAVPLPIPKKDLLESTLKEGVINYLIERETAFIIGWLEGKEGRVLLIYQPF